MATIAALARRHELIAPHNGSAAAEPALRQLVAAEGQRQVVATESERIAHRTRDAKFVGYVDRWAKRAGWTVRDKRAAAQVFAGLLQAHLFEEVLLGLCQPSDAEIVEKAAEAAESMLLLLNDGRF